MRKQLTCPHNKHHVIGRNLRWLNKTCQVWILSVERKKRLNGNWKSELKGPDRIAMWWKTTDRVRLNVHCPISLHTLSHWIEWVNVSKPLTGTVCAQRSQSCLWPNGFCSLAQVPFWLVSTSWMRLDWAVPIIVWKAHSSSLAEVPDLKVCPFSLWEWLLTLSSSWVCPHNYFNHWVRSTPNCVFCFSWHKQVTIFWTPYVVMPLLQWCPNSTMTYLVASTR